MPDSTSTSMRSASDEMAPACISAIFEHTSENSHIRASSLGEDIFIHKNYTDFRPFTPNMNVSDKPFRFKSNDQKTRKEIALKHKIHNDYLENELPDHFKPIIAGKLTKNSKGEICGSLQNINPVFVPKHKLSAHLRSEERLYITSSSSKNAIREKRGIITKVSKKSSNRLKKFLASIPDLGLWIDFTFPDDVLVGKTLAERRDFANACLKKLKRYLHSIGLKEIWKKEFTDRKSGQLKGLPVPHYHVALSGLSRKQQKDWQLTSIKILHKWVKIVGSNDENALVVACHRKSFRRIESSKQAISYIGKYFSKTNEVEDETGEVISIGRAWGYARVLKDEIPEPHHLYLNSTQSIKFRRFMKRYKKLTPNKKFIGAYEQMIKGYATFLFADENTILRFLMSIGVDITQDQGIPF